MQVDSPDYIEHRVFSELAQYAEFYRRFATSVFLFSSMGTKAICNIDSYIYSSIQGTIESIAATLSAGRIGDSYTLVRRYHDSAVINIYSNLYLRDNFSLSNFVVEHIQAWLRGDRSLPEYRVMSRYIRESELLRPINDLLYSDDRYKLLRGRCNDLTHYNFYEHILLNDRDVYVRNRGWWLDHIAKDVRDLFSLHIGSILFINPHYMMSSDYMDAIECGMLPEEGSQYWVSPFIREMFDTILSKTRPDIAFAIKECSPMQL